jgi:chloride channel 7
MRMMGFSIQPGTYALIGAASFFSGVCRMTLSLSVIMLEITNDLYYLPAIMLSVMFAKWTGDFFTPPLYEALMEIKMYPFLDQEPPIEMDMLVSSDIMATQVKLITETPRVRDVIRLLRECDHNGFPVVSNQPVHFSSHLLKYTKGAKKSSRLRIHQKGLPTAGSEPHLGPGSGRVLRGLILRKQLLILLNERCWAPHLRKFCAFEMRNLMASVDMKDAHLVLDRLSNEINDSEKASRMDLRPFMNRSPFSVHYDFHSVLCFRLFRSMGLRHLPVVNDSNEVVGIITRKDIIHPLIQEKFDTLIRNRRVPVDYSPPTSDSDDDHDQNDDGSGNHSDTFLSFTRRTHRQNGLPSKYQRSLPALRSYSYLSPPSSSPSTPYGSPTVIALPAPQIEERKQRASFVWSSRLSTRV